VQRLVVHDPSGRPYLPAAQSTQSPGVPAAARLYFPALHTTGVEVTEAAGQ
jgi:hypothetical protein